MMNHVPLSIIWISSVSNNSNWLLLLLYTYTRMTDLRTRRSETGHTRIRSVPIAVTPAGFWCCPSPSVFPKALKSQMNQTKPKPKSSSSPTTSSQKSSSQKSSTRQVGKKQNSNSSRFGTFSNVQKCVSSDVLRPALASSPTSASSSDRVTKSPIVINPQRKMSIGFGKQETSDVKLLVSGKDGIVVGMNVHKNVLADHSSFFDEKFFRESSPVLFIEIGDCEDVEIYAETVGLMYCRDIKQRLIKLSVTSVLRILKVAESLGFHSCVKSCLEYLEAAPWVGEEEECVLSSIRDLHQNDNFGISPVLKRVSSEIPNPPKEETLSQIMEIVLRSNDDRGRRDMKSMVLKLLKDNSFMISGSVDMRVETLYRYCHSCLDSLLNAFRQASEDGFPDKSSLNDKDPIVRKISLEADNLLWLVEIMVDRHVGDEFAKMWANTSELAALHSKIPIVSWHLVSCVTARLYVGIGRREILASKDTRHMLLHIWLQPLIEDYDWLQHGCRSFNRKVVEEGIGKTILTLPLEDQQSILLLWLGIFLKIGDNCPNLQRAFEVWWRRTFIQPHFEQQSNELIC
ncbi:BTB/POZ domain-containing protein [Zostera marina]|uniref:BTB/POZ domain-containing protein n=1 Tax=Zostera marina TaxID=29655 RepID=A0A0K9Q4M1_ZOSMR|nr:BTB/POZ domain-containing protein [Zostera marina]